MTYLFQNGLLRRQGAVVEAAHSITADGLASFQLDLDDGSYQVIVIDAGVTSIEISGFTGTAWQVGMSLRIEVVQPSAGNCTVTWPSDIVWDGGGAPFLSTAGDSMDSFEFNVSVLGAGKQMVGSMTGSFTAPAGGGGGGGGSSFANTDCASFGGGYLEAATSSDHDFSGYVPGESISFSLWVKLGSITTTQTFLSKFGGVDGYTLSIDTAGEINFSIWNQPVQPAVENALWYITNNSPLVVGKWHHIVAIFDDVDASPVGLARIYVDGVDTNAPVHADPLTAPYGPYDRLVGDASTTTKFRLGSRGAGTGSILFGGKMDEVSVWSKALSASEVAALYNASVPTDLTGEIGLESWYRFKPTDDFTGTVDGIDDELGNAKLTSSPSGTASASDPASGLSHWWKLDDSAIMPADSGYAGSMLMSSGNPALISGGIAGGGKDSMEFDGVDDVFSATGADTMAGQDRTYSMWIKLAAKGPADTIFSLREDTTYWTSGGIDLGINAYGNLVFYTGNYYTNATEPLVAPTTVGTWAHVVCVCRYTQNLMPAMYVDGLIGSSGGYGAVDGTISGGAATRTFAIGDRDPARGFECEAEISDFRIYDRVLEQADVDLIYAAGMGQW